MKVWRSAILAGALALAASPLVAEPQAPPQEPPRPPAAPFAPGQPQFERMPPPERFGGRHGWDQFGRPGRRHHRRGAGLAMMLRNPAIRERLGISAEQAARMETQQRAFARAMVRNRADIEVKHMELEELASAEKPDRAAIEKKLRELTEARFVADKAGLENRLAVQGMFTPEQREKMRQMFWEKRQGGPRPGPRPMPAPPPAE